MALSKTASMYARFAASFLASLVAMYILAFSQVAQPSHFHFSLSVLWISLSMLAAMGIIMLAFMPSMLPDRRAAPAIGLEFAVLLVGAVWGSRTEAGVGEDQFLRSMIPHHSRAIHMCHNADLSDPEIVRCARTS